MVLAGVVWGAQQDINLGTPNSGTGDSLYTAFGKVQGNFDELYSAIATPGAVSIRRGTNVLQYQSLTNAFNDVQSGDTVTIGGGTWSVNGHYYTTDVGDISSPQYLWLKSVTNVIVQGIGPGTILALNSYGNGITIDNCRNIVIRDLTIIGSTTGMTGASWLAAAINHRRTNDQTTIQNVAFESIPDQAISHICDQYGRPSTSWIVTGCRFRNIGTTLLVSTGLPDGSCVSGAPANLVFTGNFGTNLNAIAVEFDTQGDDVSGAHYGDGLVSGNVLVGIYDAAVGMPQWFGNRQSRITITGNTFAERESGYRPTGHAMIAHYGNSDVTIVGNTFSASSQSLMAFVTLGNGLTGSETVFGTNVVISGNTFSGGGYGIYSDSGVYGLSISDNVFRDQGQVSAQVWANGFSIANNVFSGNSRNSYGTYALMMFANAADVLMDNGVIANNTFSDTLPTPRMGGAIAVLANNTPTNITLLHNNIGALTNTSPRFYFLNYAPSSATFPSSIVSSNNISASGAFLAASGNTGLPGYGFSDNTDVGFYLNGSSIVATIDNAYKYALRSDGLMIKDGNWIGWADPANFGAYDVAISRAHPGVLSLNYGVLTNASAIIVTTDATLGSHVPRLSQVLSLIASGGGDGGEGFTNMVTSTMSYASTLAPSLSIANLTTKTDVPRRVTLHCTLTGNVTTVSAPTGTVTDGDTMVWELIQDGTGGRTISGWNSVYAFGSDITGITLSTTASKRDFVTMIYNGTAAKWYVVGFVRGY